MFDFILFFITPVLSLILVLCITPSLRKLALKTALVDQPNHRKVHHTPVPLIGGIVIFSSVCVVLAVSLGFGAMVHQLNVLLIGSLILLVIGVADDKTDISPTIRLLVQVVLACFVYASGIKITSAFGLFGVYELAEPIQFILTLIVITGTVNAFNLTDGIDGLAAGLAIIGFVTFAILGLMAGLPQLTLLCCTMTGALIGFLKFNLGKSQKIFMGDAGSLALGYLLVVSGIWLIKAAAGTSAINVTFIAVVGVLILPVLDSLRVYHGRMKKGYHPMKADKTHFHHLLLNLGLKHLTASISMVVIVLVLLLLSVLLNIFCSLTTTVLLLLFFFSLLASVLKLNSELKEWQKRIKEMEVGI